MSEKLLGITKKLSRLALEFYLYLLLFKVQRKFIIYMNIILCNRPDVLYCAIQKYQNKMHFTTNILLHVFKGG